jgi:Na+/melibiose symporter-like transporter
MAAVLPLTILLRYAALALPLAFVGLPIYVHVPKFYAAEGGIDLALLGAILLGVRLFDCLLDPFIGWCADRYPQHRRRVMVVASALLAGAYFLLFNPPASPSIVWLTATLVVVYVCYSTLMIQYYAAGVTLGGSGHDATRLSSAREGVMLLGVLLASVLPPMLMEVHGAAASYRILALILSVLLIGGGMLSLRLPCFAQAAAPALPFSIVPFMACLRDGRIRRVLAVYVVNAIPGAITGTLFLFYAADVLRASDAMAGLLLALYFVAAALAMPAWVAVSRRVGRVNSLAIGMGLAVASFLFALMLGPGDAVWFALICAASGAAAGADLALLPAMYGGALAARGDSSGIGFGLWNVASKLPLALAAGLALPLLAAFGYTPGGGQVTVLSLAYAGLPCIVKLIALALLLAYPPEPRGRP